MNRSGIELADGALRRLMTVPGLDHVEIRRQILKALQRTIGFDAGAISTIDPATVLWTN
ncbi:MAG: hypothetical protein HY673_14510 [Chloroflexi bacterium]|nr:hypothetical protein [Chloroflexota bacterium]